ncbi:hypothetical protein HJFPF1_05900 [Paramyrothecium foliicola]|nr:hypothetical protein HJFPF1_05900 [Paramyrothecium foliicola]
MRLHVTKLILALTALSSLPESSGRVIPNAVSTTVDGEYEHEANHHARAIPLRIGVKPGAIRIGAGAGAGKTPAGMAGGEPRPVRIGAPKSEEKGHTGQPSRPGTDVKPPNRKPPVNDDSIIRCRGESCAPPLTPAEAELFRKGEAAIELAESPKNWVVNYASRYGNYDIDPPKKKKDKNGKEEDKPPSSVEKSIPPLGLDKDYGFSYPSSWKTYDIKSRGNEEFSPIAKVSIARGQNNNKDYIAIVAHERFKKNDGNRYELDGNGKQILENGKPKENPDKDHKFVPVSQLVFKAAQKSGKLTTADRIFLVSDTVVNDAAMWAIPAAHAAINKSGQFAVFRKGAPGEEGKQFKILAGLDNNRSFLDSVGRNPDFFKDYDVISIRSHDDNFMSDIMASMSLELKRKAV